MRNQISTWWSSDKDRPNLQYGTSVIKESGRRVANFGRIRYVHLRANTHVENISPSIWFMGKRKKKQVRLSPIDLCANQLKKETFEFKTWFVDRSTLKQNRVDNLKFISHPHQLLVNLLSSTGNWWWVWLHPWRLYQLGRGSSNRSKKALVWFWNRMINLLNSIRVLIL